MTGGVPDQRRLILQGGSQWGPPLVQQVERHEVVLVQRAQRFQIQHGLYLLGPVEVQVEAVQSNLISKVGHHRIGDVGRVSPHEVQERVRHGNQGHRAFPLGGLFQKQETIIGHQRAERAALQQWRHRRSLEIVLVDQRGDVKQQVIGSGKTAGRQIVGQARFGQYGRVVIEDTAAADVWIEVALGEQGGVGRHLAKHCLGLSVMVAE